MITRIRIRETNCYLVQGREGAVLIDAGPGRAAALVDGIRRAGVRPEQMRLILVTHGHLDHYGAAPGVQAWCGAPVAAHPIAPGYSLDPRNALPPAQTVRGSIVRLFYLLVAPRARVRPLRADVLLEEDTDLSSYGLDARTILLPGHAPGSLGVVTSEGDVFVGDLFVNYTVPSQPIYLDDRPAWQASYDRLRALAPRTIYVGHGDPFPGEQLARIYPARYQFRWWVR